MVLEVIAAMVLAKEGCYEDRISGGSDGSVDVFGNGNTDIWPQPFRGGG